MAASGDAAAAGAAVLFDEDLEDDVEYASSEDEAAPRAAAKPPAKRKAPGAAVTKRMRTYGCRLRDAFPGRAPPADAVARLAAALKLTAARAAAFDAWFAKKEKERANKQARVLEPAPPLREAFLPCTRCGKLRCVSDALARGRRPFACDQNPDLARSTCHAPEEMDAAAAAAWAQDLAAMRAAAQQLLPRKPPAKRARAQTWQQKLLGENGAFAALTAHLAMLGVQPSGEEEEEEDEAEEEEEAADGGDGAAAPRAPAAAQPARAPAAATAAPGDADAPAPRRGKAKRAKPARWTRAAATAVLEEAEAQGLFGARTTGATVRKALVARGLLPASFNAARVTTVLNNFRRAAGALMRPHAFMVKSETDESGVETVVSRDARIFSPSFASMSSYASPAEYARLYSDAGPAAAPPPRR